MFVLKISSRAFVPSLGPYTCKEGVQAWYLFIRSRVCDSSTEHGNGEGTPKTQFISRYEGTMSEYSGSFLVGLKRGKDTKPEKLRNKLQFFNLTH